MKSLFAAFVLPCLLAAQAGAQVMSYDDGGAENAVGAGADPLIFLNRFAATPGITTVRGLLASFGSPAFPGGSGGNGQSITFCVWSDPNGDGSPGDGLLLASGAGTTAGVDTNSFISYAFASPVTINTVNFFVGYFIQGQVNAFPDAVDQNGPNSTLPGTAWAFIGSDVNTLSANGAPFDLVGLGLGMSMIRADVGIAAVPEPGSVISGVLAFAATGGMLLRRRSVSS